MRTMEMTTKDYFLSVWSNSPRQYYKKCTEDSEENICVDMGAERVECEIKLTRFPVQ